MFMQADVAEAARQHQKSSATTHQKELLKQLLGGQPHSRFIMCYGFAAATNPVRRNLLQPIRPIASDDLAGDLIARRERTKARSSLTG